MLEVHRTLQAKILNHSQVEEMLDRHSDRGGRLQTLISQLSGAVPWDSSAFTRRWMSTLSTVVLCGENSRLVPSVWTVVDGSKP
mgnify:CR=1 FL=1